MMNFAQECNTILAVTHAFRKAGQLLGTYTEPAQGSSPHLVGHAIDINLWDSRSSQKCNTKCMKTKGATYASCFLGKIENDPDLIWLSTAPASVEISRSKIENNFGTMLNAVENCPMHPNPYGNDPVECNNYSGYCLNQGLKYIWSQGFSSPLKR